MVELARGGFTSEGTRPTVGAWTLYHEQIIQTDGSVTEIQKTGRLFTNPKLLEEDSYYYTEWPLHTIYYVKYVLGIASCNIKDDAYIK